MKNKMRLLAGLLCSLFFINIAAVYADPATLLLHADGNFTDSASSPHSVTANNGATTSNAQFKFGTHSILFDGTNDYLSSDDSPDWYFDGDFTIDFWVRFNSLPANASYFYLLSQNEADYSKWQYLRIINSGGVYYYQISIGSGSSEIISVSVASTGILINTWYHIAFTRSGNNFRISQDGIQQGSTAVNSSAFPNISTPLYIGSLNTGYYFLNGYIDEFRIAKGTAVWTSDFTRPTAAYTTSNLTAPDNINATGSNTAVDLTWDSVSGATGYKVKYGTSSGNYGTPVDVGNDASPTITGLTNNVTYYFVACAYDGSGDGPYSDEVSAMPEAPATPPAAPTLNSPVAGNTEISLSWPTVSGATGYKVKYGTSSGNYGTPVDVGNVTSHTISSLNNGTTYYIVLVAYNSIGDSSNSAERTCAPAVASSLWTANGNDIYYDDGNVGINTTTPATSLDVNGTVRANEMVVDTDSGLTVQTANTEIGSLNFSDGTTEGYVEYNHANNSMALGTSGANAIEIDSTQNVTFKGNVTVDGTINGAGGGTYYAVPKGYIRGINISYIASPSLRISQGNGECNGHFFEINSEYSYNMTSLGSGANAIHYIYIDDSASNYPNPTLTDTTTRPYWSYEKIGWYNGNDRCIGAVYCYLTAQQIYIAGFENIDDTYCYIPGAGGPCTLVNTYPPNDLGGNWNEIDLSDKIPVNAVGVYVEIMAYKSGENLVTAHLRYQDSNLMGISYIMDKETEMAHSYGLISWHKGTTSDQFIIQYNVTPYTNIQVNIILYGYKLDR